MEPKRNTPSIIRLVLVTIPVIAIVVYIIIALNTGDMAWFSSSFDERPYSIVLHCYGKDVLIEPGDENFNSMTEMINSTLSGSKRWDPLSLSEVSYLDYQTATWMMTLEATYQPAVRIHSNVKFFSNVDTLIIPLDGRHAGTNAVFGRHFEQPVAGSLHVESTVELIEYIAAEGLCQKP